MSQAGRRLRASAHAIRCGTVGEIVRREIQWLEAALDRSMTDCAVIDDLEVLRLVGRRAHLLRVLVPNSDLRGRNRPDHDRAQRAAYVSLVGYPWDGGAVQAELDADLIAV